MSTTTPHTLSMLLATTLIFLGSARGEDFNQVAIKVNTQDVGVREVEKLFSDSYVLIQDKLKRGEIQQKDLETFIRAGWNEAIETATQDKITDQRADKYRREIMDSFYRARPDESQSSARRSYERSIEPYMAKLRRELIAAAGGEEELRQALKRRGQTLRDWEGNLERELFRREVLYRELGPVSGRPSDARSYYAKHPELFCQNEAWRLRRIRIRKSRFSSPENARKAVELTRTNISEGADFGEVAAGVSDDPDYAEHGGLLTKNGSTDLPPGNFPAEEKIAEALKDGEISAPIDGGDWFVLVQRVGHLPLKVQNFEEVSERCEALAYGEKMKQKKKELFEKLKRESYVEVIQKDPPERILKAALGNAADFSPPRK